jgi:HlyD family secretion protein
VVTYDAVIDVDNPDHRLKPGMTANVTFVYAERKGVLRIPSAALRFRPPPELLAAASSGAVLPAHKKKKHEKAAAGGATAAAATPALAAARPGHARSVWVLRGEGLVEVQVEPGVADGSRVEVVGGGLREGDVLVTDAVDKTERAEGKKPKGIF